MASERWYERLNPTDATFLYLEDGDAHMHVGGVFIYQGTPPSYREFVDFVASRLDRVPRYRQRLAWVPFNAGRPVWIDDDHFDPEYHLRHSALPAPGGDEVLKRAAARIFGQPLDRRRPLWELELVEGLADDRFAIVSKTHHAVLDGIAGNDVISAITDDAPTFGPSGFSSRWTPRPAPRRRDLLFDALRDQIAVPIDLLRGVFRPGSEARAALREIATGLVPLAGLALRGRAPPVSLNAPLGPHRRYEISSVDLATVKRVREATGATINDVVLAIVAGALRRLLQSRGEKLRDDVRAFVPVNARPRGGSRAINNQVAAVYCPLPLTESDPVTRLRRISSTMNDIKKHGQAAASLAVARLGTLSPPALAASAARKELGYRRFNLVVSNVPGSPVPRYFLGRKLLAFPPLIPLSTLQTLSVGVHSYAGALHFGLLADLDHGADLPVFARALPEMLEELVQALQANAAVPAAAVRPVTPAASRLVSTAPASFPQGAGRDQPPPAA